TTQLRLLAQWFGAEREVVRTREPGGTELGRNLRELLLHGGDIDPRTEALLFAADRAHHVASLIRPALQRGAVVLTDRYLDSSVAYQGGGREISAQQVEDLSLFATQGLLPHLTVLLDLDPQQMRRRIGGDPDRLGRAGAPFPQRPRRACLARAAAGPQRGLVLGASQHVQAVQSRIRGRGAALLPAEGGAGMGGSYRSRDGTIRQEER